MSKNQDEAYRRYLKEAQHELHSIQETGNGMMWAGIAGGVILIAGSLLASIAMLGWQGFLALNPLWYVAGFVFLTGPVIAIVMAGMLARQSMQTARANALVLRSANILLMPADAASARIEMIGRRVKDETSKIDEMVENAHASLNDLKDKLIAERDAVSKTAEDGQKAVNEIMEKLTNERNALEELVSAVDDQAKTMNDAVPRQARIIVEAARQAQEEISKADNALDERLQAMDDSGRQMGEALAHLDELSVQGETRVHHLVELLSTLDGKLAQSAKTVDTAVKASEMATNAAQNTGNAFADTVNAALDSARDATELIKKHTQDAMAEVQSAMFELRTVGKEAEAAAKAAGDEARAQADETEKRIEAMSEMMFRAATRSTSAAEAGLERARLRIERASALLNGLNDSELGLSASPFDILNTPAPSSSDFSVSTGLRPRSEKGPENTATKPFAQQTEIEELNGLISEAGANAINGKRAEDDTTPDITPTEVSLEQLLEGLSPNTVSPQEETEENASDDISDDADDGANGFEEATNRQLGLTWKDLLAGLEMPSEERDEAARYIMTEIEQAGMSLSELIPAKETRKIAHAARRGDRHRRRAVKEFTGTMVQNLMSRIQDDTKFNTSVEQFLTTEEADALRALSEAEQCRSAASPRLAAYLLLDSAFSAP